jgi:hypothetical protein
VPASRLATSVQPVGGVTVRPVPPVALMCATRTSPTARPVGSVTLRLAPVPAPLLPEVAPTRVGVGIAPR